MIESELSTLMDEIVVSVWEFSADLLVENVSDGVGLVVLNEVVFAIILHVSELGSHARVIFVGFVLVPHSVPNSLESAHIQSIEFALKCS